MNNQDRSDRPNMYECTIGLSFGTSTYVGSPNAAIAARMSLYAVRHALPMVADRKLVEALPGLQDRMSYVVEGEITNHRAQGVVTYGTLSEAKNYMTENELHEALLFGQKYHMPRILRQAKKLDMIAVPAQSLPDWFDKDSEQIWTRSRSLWIPFNAIGSLLLKKRGQL